MDSKNQTLAELERKIILVCEQTTALHKYRNTGSLFSPNFSEAGQ